MSVETFDRSLLSAREDAILDLAIEGLTDVQIAQRLGITQSTVNSYWVRIRGKLGQLSRTELVALALKEKARTEMAEVVAKFNLLQSESFQHARITQDYQNAEVFRAALDAVPEAILACCEAGTIRYANERLAAMFGYRADEMIGGSVQSLVANRIRKIEAFNFEEYLRDPQLVRLGIDQTLYARRADGSEFRVILLLDHRPTSTGTIITFLVRDFLTEVDTRRRFVAASAV